MEYVDHISNEQYTYRIRDVEAARVDNHAVGGTVWDSRTLVDRLCPSFTVSGKEAVCYPVEGYPLSVSSTITATQSGEGTPGPDNVRPIEPCRLIRLQQRSAADMLAYDRDPGMPVWGGRFHWDTGVLELTHKKYTLDENAQLRKHPDGKRYYILGGLADMASGNRQVGFCDTLPVITATAQIQEPGIQLGSNNNVPYVLNMEQLDPSIVDVDSLKEFLREYPITFTYPLAQPEQVQLTGAVITAFAGENRLESATGETTVSGKQCPIYMQQGGDDV